MRTLGAIEEKLDQPVKTQLTEQHLALIAEVQQMRHEYATGVRKPPEAPFTRRQKQIQEMLKNASRNQ